MSLDSKGLWTDSPSSISLTSGGRTDPLHMDPADIHITDIAHALSRQCRYNGHVGGYLSVARHSLWVMERVASGGCTPQLLMTALLHDAAETYLGDLVRPLKHSDFGKGYLEVEQFVEKCIAFAFDLEWPFPPDISDADDWVLMQRELGGELARWTWSSTPDEDEQAFLLAYRRLVGERRAQS